MSELAWTLEFAPIVKRLLEEGALPEKDAGIRCSSEATQITCLVFRQYPETRAEALERDFEVRLKQIHLTRSTVVKRNEAGTEAEENREALAAWSH